MERVHLREVQLLQNKRKLANTLNHLFFDDNGIVVNKNKKSKKTQETQETFDKKIRSKTPTNPNGTLSITSDLQNPQIRKSPYKIRRNPRTLARIPHYFRRKR
jgi:hypothetical protein